MWGFQRSALQILALSQVPMQIFAAKKRTSIWAAITAAAMSRIWEVVSQVGALNKRASLR